MKHDSLLIFTEEVSDILNDFDIDKQKILAEHYLIVLRGIISKGDITPEKIKALNFAYDNIDLFDLKMLGIVTEEFVHSIIYEIRGVILECIENDYTQAGNITFKPENWICKVIGKMVELFNLRDSDAISRNKNIIDIFHDKFIDEVRHIFIGNEKFNTKGNFLLIDLVYYEKRIKRIDNSLYARFISNFEKGTNMELDEIRRNIK